jgi:translation elongation factor EF-4
VSVLFLICFAAQPVISWCWSQPAVAGCMLQVGYVIPGIKDVKAARVGDTWHLAKQPVAPLPGFKPIKPMVFAGGQVFECAEPGSAPCRDPGAACRSMVPVSLFSCRTSSSHPAPAVSHGYCCCQRTSHPRTGLYPASADEYEGLAAAIERLGLNDASVTVKKETSDALGAGFRCACGTLFC